MGLKTHLSKGEMSTIVGLVGDTTRVDPKQFEVDECVERIMKVSEPYKLANRAFHPEDSIIDVSGVKVGGNNLTLIAGPCSVESKEQVIEIARSIKKVGHTCYEVELINLEPALTHSKAWVHKV